MELKFIPAHEFKRINSLNLEKNKRLYLSAEMARLNTLTEVKKAGSGHLGSSLSAMDIVIKLYYDYLNIKDVGIDNPNRDIYFSSKGHDAPGLYSVFYALGIIPEDKFLKLRRLGGLDGHPDVGIPGCEVNTGSLGMGISKGKGIALAKKINNYGGKVFILTGDGEFQEGQNFEALQSAIQQKIYNLTVIMDHNKVQSDRPVEKILDLGNLIDKIESFGWYVARCNGHDFDELEKKLLSFEKITDKPKFLICDTIKGRGVSFMEHPQSLKDNNGFYKWHSGAPDDSSYEKGFNEMLEKINKFCRKNNIDEPELKIAEVVDTNRIKLKETAEKVVVGYGDALVEFAKDRKDIIVLDADLSGDCGLLNFEKAFPDRFVECGIAEQDMVSMAGGLALQGFLPVVNSFGVFLSSRANEQIYTNSTEHTKIIYTCHFSGLIPAGPGNSHQSMRDISLFGAIHNCTIMEPCNNKETKELVKWCIYESKENCMIRLAISPSPRNIILPDNYKLELGKGTILTEGKEAVVFSYGPVMLNEVLTAHENLEKEKCFVKVIDMPWLNKIDDEWLEKEISGFKEIFVVENHSLFGGLGDSLLNAVNKNDRLRDIKVIKIGVEGLPACGTPAEVLNYHKLDGKNLAIRIKNN